MALYYNKYSFRKEGNYEAEIYTAAGCADLTDRTHAVQDCDIQPE